MATNNGKKQSKNTTSKSTKQGKVMTSGKSKKKTSANQVMENLGSIKAKFSLTRVLIFVVISVLLCSAFFVFKTDIDFFLNGKNKKVDLATQQGLMVHYLDVGQADCIVIELPDNKKMLIDAGIEKNQNVMIDYINKNVFNLPSENKVFDYVLLTHSDADHCGGMAKIFDEYQVNKVFRPKIYINNTDDKAKDTTISASATVKVATSNIYKKTIDKMYAEPNCEVYFTDISLLNSSLKICASDSQNYYEFEFYTPNEDYYDEVNSFSPIMTLKYNGKTFMFTGDSTNTSEGEALEKPLPKVDVLKVGHHGSNTGSMIQFLRKIEPTYSIILVGKGNSYGHPTDRTLGNLKQVGSTVYRTDINKNIVAIVDEAGKLNIVLDISNYINPYLLLAGVEIVIAILCFAIQKGRKVKI